jgi:hypothetical protein
MTVKSITIDTPIEIAPTVRSLITPESAVLMDLEKGAIFTLNGVGSVIWQHLRDGCTRSDIVDSLCKDFDVPRYSAEADVTVFIEYLYSYHLVRKSGQ